MLRSPGGRRKIAAMCICCQRQRKRAAVVVALAPRTCYSSKEQKRSWGTQGWTRGLGFLVSQDRVKAVLSVPKFSK